MQNLKQLMNLQARIIKEVSTTSAAHVSNGRNAQFANCQKA